MTLEILAGVQMLSSIIIPNQSGLGVKGQEESDQSGRWQQHFLVTKGQPIRWPEAGLGVKRDMEREGRDNLDKPSVSRSRLL